MATLPTDDDKVRKALDIFKHFNVRAGGVLMPGNLIAITTEKGWRMEDVRTGLTIGHGRGLFEDGPNNSTKLTESGFAQM